MWFSSALLIPHLLLVLVVELGRSDLKLADCDLTSSGQLHSEGEIEDILFEFVVDVLLVEVYVLVVEHLEAVHSLLFRPLVPHCGHAMAAPDVDVLTPVALLHSEDVVPRLIGFSLLDEFSLDLLNALHALVSLS